MLGSASRFQVQFVFVSARQHQSARRPASASASKKQPAAVCGSYRRPVPASTSEPASQPGEPDRKTDRDRATSEPGRQLGRQTAANRIATQLIRQVGSQVAAAASLQQALFFGALLCSTSPPAETRLTVYRRSQHRDKSPALVLWKSPLGYVYVGTGGKPSTWFTPERLVKLYYQIRMDLSFFKVFIFFTNFRKCMFIIFL